MYPLENDKTQVIPLIKEVTEILFLSDSSNHIRRLRGRSGGECNETRLIVVEFCLTLTSVSRVALDRGRFREFLC